MLRDQLGPFTRSTLIAASPAGRRARQSLALTGRGACAVARQSRLVDGGLALRPPARDRSIPRPALETGRCGWGVRDPGLRAPSLPAHPAGREGAVLRPASPGQPSRALGRPPAPGQRTALGTRRR